MKNLQCNDEVVGRILAGWRYDISALAPDMRGDYEQHLRECPRCHRLQRRCRRVDIGLWFLTSVSALVWLLAFFGLRRFHPLHAAVMEWASVAAFLVSAVLWMGVALSTPAPMVVLGKAIEKARILNDKLPESVRERLPEELRNRIERP